MYSLKEAFPTNTSTKRKRFPDEVVEKDKESKEKKSEWVLFRNKSVSKNIEEKENCYYLS